MSMTDGIQRRLAKQFIARAQDLPAYRRRVAVECDGFPEGDLFPFAFPALALCADLERGRGARGAREAASALVEASRAAVSARLGDVRVLGPGAREAVYLGWLALVLARWEQVSGETTHADERRHLCAILRTELEALPEGGPLDSFPGMCWPFDTIPPLLALKLSDALDGESRSAAAIERHLVWIETCGSDAATGLPASHVGRHREPDGAPPRGCDLSLRVGLMKLLDESRARTIYRQYTRHFWSELFLIAGFREYPSGHAGHMDADSGPIVLGLGMAATGFGLNATRAAGDSLRGLRLGVLLFKFDVLWRLAGALFKRQLHGRVMPGLGAPIATDCVTGFLFGDASLVLTLTWPR